MKRHLRSPILFLLFGLAFFPAAFAQSLPSSMAYSSSILVGHAPTEVSQKLLIADNSLNKNHHSGFDLSAIPAAPDSVVRESKVSSSGTVTDKNADAVSAQSISKLNRSAALLGVLAVAYLATRKRSNSRMNGDISELRNFPKKRLAHRRARA